MNNTLRSQFLRNVAQTSPAPLMVEVERAEGIYFWSPDGKRYTDLIAGVTVNNAGHDNPAVRDAVIRQVERYTHVMVYGELVEKPQVQYASKLAQALGTGLDSVYFVNSGSEAVDGALKLAKRYTGRTELVSFANSYHGSGHGPMSVMGGEEFKNAFRPLLPDTRLLRYGSFEDIKFITRRTAAVVAEPVQSEAGVRLAPEGWLEALRQRCDRTGALLILDEIQTAFGRCGSMFAHQLYGVRPDIICLAKALGGGMPLGAFISSGGIMSMLTHDPVLGHITTFGGHPVCCAAGMAAFDFIKEGGYCERAEEAGNRFERALAGHPAILGIRRAGLLMAVELGCPEKLMRMMAGLLECGIMSDWFLFCDTAFRISPPLTITDGQVDETCETIRTALDAL